MNKKKNKKDKYFTLENFILIKNFILKNGDKQTYCNMFNNNPHYNFKLFDVYLNPEPGGPHNHPQWNINCDPELSDFHEIVIYDYNEYFYFRFNQEINKVDIVLHYKQNIDFINQGNKYFKKIINMIS